MTFTEKKIDKLDIEAYSFLISVVVTEIVFQAEDPECWKRGVIIKRKQGSANRFELGVLIHYRVQVSSKNHQLIKIFV